MDVTSQLPYMYVSLKQSSPREMTFKFGLIIFQKLQYISISDFFLFHTHIFHVYYILYCNALAGRID